MNLIDYLPDFYESSAEVKDIQSAIQTQVVELRAARDNFLLQFNVLTATWGLDYWERALGIVSRAEESTEFRRARVISKLRGAGTTTEAMIKNVAESFSNGDVDVTPFPAQSRFEVKFTGTRGIPPKMQDLTAAIDEIKPAHLAYIYVFVFLTWDDFEAYNHTWDGWDALNLTWDEIEIYKE